MSEIERKNVVKKFVTHWSGHGYEKGETHSFWLSFLRDVLDVAQPEKFIRFEVPVKLKHTSFIDVFLPDTKVIIEQKSLSENLSAEKSQSDGSTLTPYEQAQRYITGLPLSMHPRRIIVCNFAEFLIYDMEMIQEKKTVPEARAQFEKVGLYLRAICGVGSIDADDIRRVVERYEYELDTLPVVFVDYLQILKAHDPHMTDKQAVDYNVLRLKQLSRDYKIPVIALASMNRTSYSDIISMVSIKESGAIEYTSDVCIGLQMAAMDSIVNGAKGKQGQQEKEVRKLKSKLNRDMQAVILKHRNGQIGAEIPFTYCAMFNHFGEEELGGVPISDFDCVPDI